MECLHESNLKGDESRRLFEKGQRLLPGGVSSPGRAFAEVDGPPLFIQQGNGKFIEDADGNRYVDFICGLGPMILGHGHHEVLAAVNRQFACGSVFGAPTEIEYRLAETILETSRFLDSIRFTCSGTEATMTALRIARAATGKQGVLKFKGGYHGHSDVLLAGGTKRHMLAADGQRQRNGIESAMQANTYIADFNDIGSVAAALEAGQREIGAIIVEPVPSNMGVIPPEPAFLAELRSLADAVGAVLIFDEVVSGFRHRFGPVSDELGVRPDLITFGKIIGGGLPIGAFSGREDLMALLVERGSVFQGGTFAGSPLTMAAGLAQLGVLKRDDVPTRTNLLAARLAAQLREGFVRHGLPFSVQHYGSLVTPVLAPGKTRLFGYADVEQQDKALFRRIYGDLLRSGYAVPPTIEEPIFVSACHTPEDIDGLAQCYAAAAARYAADRSSATL
jgi:glutamate-1-semialdehyde 2,1-aminomutase